VSLIHRRQEAQAFGSGDLTGNKPILDRGAFGLFLLVGHRSFPFSPLSRPLISNPAPQNIQPLYAADYSRATAAVVPPGWGIHGFGYQRNQAASTLYRSRLAPSA
jgi:hypothetical protein